MLLVKKYLFSLVLNNLLLLALTLKAEFRILDSAFIIYGDRYAPSGNNLSHLGLRVSDMGERLKAPISVPTLHLLPPPCKGSLG